MESIVRGAAVYFLLLVIMRFSGRRTFAEMTPFDLVLVLIVAETTQQALLGDDFSITNAALLIVTLFSIDILLSHLKLVSPALDKWLDGQPTLLIAEGELRQRALKKARVDVKDILESARETRGIGRLDEIRHAVLEVDGGISIIPKSSASGTIKKSP